MEILCMFANYAPHAIAALSATVSALWQFLYMQLRRIRLHAALPVTTGGLHPGIGLETIGHSNRNQERAVRGCLDHIIKPLLKTGEEVSEGHSHDYWFIDDKKRKTPRVENVVNAFTTAFTTIGNRYSLHIATIACTQSQCVFPCKQKATAMVDRSRRSRELEAGLNNLDNGN